MESLQNYYKRELLFPALICHSLFQNKVNLRLLIFGWPLNRREDNRKSLIGTTKGWRRPLYGGGRFKGVPLLYYNTFESDNWPLNNHGWSLNRDSTVDISSSFIKFSGVCQGLWSLSSFIDF